MITSERFQTNKMNVTAMKGLACLNLLLSCCVLNPMMRYVTMWLNLRLITTELYRTEYLIKPHSLVSESETVMRVGRKNIRHFINSI
jgi:hypothetical protein